MRRRHIDIVRRIEVVVIGRAQEAVAIRNNLQHTFAHNRSRKVVLRNRSLLLWCIRIRIRIRIRIHLCCLRFDRQLCLRSNLNGRFALRTNNLCRRNHLSRAATAFRCRSRLRLCGRGRGIILSHLYRLFFTAGYRRVFILLHGDYTRSATTFFRSRLRLCHNRSGCDIRSVIRSNYCHNS